MQLNISFGFQISRLSNGLRSALEGRLAIHNLTAPQWATLMRMSERDDWAIKELGLSLGMDKATIGGIVQRLEARQLLQRRKDENDARIYRVSLTLCGQRIVEETANLGEAVNEVALSGLSENEKRQFLLLIQRVRRNIDY